ncbi:thioredoxin family protein [Altererythrobacter sp. H2]|uniref:protein-disulfide reductase DsbD family protein n=1 Tax=Altererythrobacter sp. H2 TaxID=3108391 RepID=UPI002B4BEADB|nr:thioredoxin family protein [Altererythrobacter sp. H2]WRK95011.1 thioredoxin family protein [Altererythrobacter sp. H2]
MIEARTLGGWRAIWLVLVAAFALFGAAAQAQPAAVRSGPGDDRISVELYADGPPRAGEEWLLAFRFIPVADEWHGYWSNPGDAGLGMTLDWQLPDGWQAGAPLYPMPRTLVTSGLMNHVFKGAYTVFVPVRVPAGSRIDPAQMVSVTLEYLACTDTICVPQQATVTRRLGDVPASSAFGAWRAALVPPLDQDGAWERTGALLRIGIPLPAAVNLARPHVFLETTDLGQGWQPAYVEAQTFRREGDLLVAEVPLRRLPLPEGAAVPPEPASVQGILSFAEGEGVRFGARAGEVPLEGKAPLAGPAEPALWALLLAALAGGLILNLMPCVFPILSLKAISLVKSGQSEAVARREGIAYTAGAVLACVGLGAVLLALRAAGEQVGWAFQLQEPGVVVALLLLAAVITANFAGLFQLPSLPLTRGGQSAGGFATGFLAAFVATPCTGPFMAAALGAALVLPAAQALLLFAALGLGLALPFLAIGLSPALRRRLPRPGPWMERFRKAMAIPMGLTALALVWLTARLGGQGFALVALVALFGVLLALAVVGRLQRHGKLAWPAFGLIAAPFAIFAAFALPASHDPASAGAAESIHDPVPFDEFVLMNTVQSQGKPVFVWFTADWCVTCKVNESAAIEREAVKQAFDRAGVVTMRGDWTRRDPAITEFLAGQGAAGVPLYLWYAPNRAPEQLPQVLTAGLLVERAEAVPLSPGSGQSAAPARSTD